jgi:DNA-binding transcriptional ArsR family regulator
MPTSHAARHSPDPDVAAVAALIGDPGRAAMLLALLGGHRLSAGDLALRGGVSPAAASAHLAKLVAGGLLRVERDGRHRLYDMAGPGVGRALEALAAIAAPPKIVGLTQNVQAARLRAARSCYDHLAGRLGVAVSDALIAQRFIGPTGERGFRITRRGRSFFLDFGIDLAAIEAGRRPVARQCIDWSEHRTHIAGALGAELRALCLARGWIERFPGSRALRITPSGSAAFEEYFGFQARG